MRVEIGVGCVGKFTELAILLCCLLSQTHKEWDLTIIDETIERRNYLDIPGVGHLLRLMMERGNQWRIFYGMRKGFHFAQSIVLSKSRHLLTWVLGEDVFFDPDCMAELVKQFDDPKVGVVAGLLFLTGDSNRVWLPDDWEERKEWSGQIHFVDTKKSINIGYGNQIQYSIHSDNKPKEVEHLIGNMMYRTELGGKWGWNLDLSYVSRTADNDFTYQFYLAGYKVLVVPTAVNWHLETYNYGTLNKNTEEFKKLCESDRDKFQERLMKWGKIKARFSK